MAYHTVEDGPWPVGTTVTAWPAAQVSGGTATGPPTSAAVALRNGVAEFANLVEGGTYVAFGHGGTQTFQAINQETALQNTVRADALPYVTLSPSAVNIDADLAAAKATLGATGGRIVLPRGAFQILSPPAFNETRNIVLEGAGGQTAGAQAATSIIYKGTGARAIDARSSFGFKLRDLQLYYDQAAFTGALVDFSQSIAQDAAYMGIEDVYLGGLGVSGATLLKLTKSISGSFSRVTFDRGAYHVRGLTSGTDYANGHVFTGCTFVNAASRCIGAAGEAWSFNGCVFQQLQNGQAGAYIQDQGLARSLSFTGCWMGDALGGSNWLHHVGHGFDVRACTVRRRRQRHRDLQRVRRASTSPATSSSSAGTASTSVSPSRGRSGRTGI